MKWLYNPAYLTNQFFQLQLGGWDRFRQMCADIGFHLVILDKSRLPTSPSAIEDESSELVLTDREEYFANLVEPVFRVIILEEAERIINDLKKDDNECDS